MQEQKLVELILKCKRNKSFQMKEQIIVYLGTK
jgi:hypothetical protein